MILFVCLYLKLGMVMYIQCKAKLPFKSEKVRISEGALLRIRVPWSFETTQSWTISCSTHPCTTCTSVLTNWVLVTVGLWRLNSIWSLFPDCCVIQVFVWPGQKSHLGKRGITLSYQYLCGIVFMTQSVWENTTDIVSIAALNKSTEAWTALNALHSFEIKSMDHAVNPWT